MDIFEKAKQDLSHILNKDGINVKFTHQSFEVIIKASVYYGEDIQSKSEVGSVPLYKLCFSTLDLPFAFLHDKMTISFDNKEFLIAKKELDSTLGIIRITLKDKTTNAVGDFNGAKPV